MVRKEVGDGTRFRRTMTPIRRSLLAAPGSSQSRRGWLVPRSRASEAEPHNGRRAGFSLLFSATDRSMLARRRGRDVRDLGTTGANSRSIASHPLAALSDYDLRHQTTHLETAADDLHHLLRLEALEHPRRPKAWFAGRADP
ncbi:MAG: hypothetical protein ACRD1T_02910 [Acidimicrobiia bacterium]